MSLYYHCDNPICHRKIKVETHWIESTVRVPEGRTAKSKTILTNRITSLDQHFCPKHSEVNIVR